MVPLISIIIPVYNNEDYIEQCICSVINQSYKNIEIIVVNDGSQDGSLGIINKYSSVDSRLVCIDQSNMGVNLARKAGLDLSKGKYVQYLDGDDSLSLDAIERLVELAEATSADIVSVPFVFCYNNGKKINSPILPVDVIFGIDYFRRIFKSEGANWNMWGNFQKRSLVYDYNIEILANVPYGQDATWMIQIFFHNPKIAVLKTPILNYNQNPQSVSYNKNATKRRYKGVRAKYYWFESFITNKGLRDEFSQELAHMQMNMTFICIRTLIFDKACEDIKTVITNLNMYPELSGSLPKIEKGMIWMFRKSSILGRFYLFCYKIKRRIY